MNIISRCDRSRMFSGMPRKAVLCGGNFQDRRRAIVSRKRHRQYEVKAQNTAKRSAMFRDVLARREE